VAAVGDRNFGLPIDLAHRLYNSLLLPHRSWYRVAPKNSQLVFVRPLSNLHQIW